jgi:carbon-monoxide dehydrogenase medium subunit
MPGVKEYYRPGSLDEALTLMRRSGVLPLAGGQHVIAAQRRDVQAFVDLQALGLDGLTVEAGRLNIGAMVRLQQLVESPQVGSLLAEAAQREGPLTYRCAATVGGTIVTHDPLSYLLLSLLVLDAQVTVQRVGGSRTISLDEMLDDPGCALGGGLITGVSTPAGTAGSAIASVARTPRDRPIVAAVVRLTRRGDACGEVRIALGGVADRPICARQAETRLTARRFDEQFAGEVASQIAAGLQPPADFRGSAAYRREMAAVLVRRALVEAWSKPE